MPGHLRRFAPEVRHATTMRAEDDHVDAHGQADIGFGPTRLVSYDPLPGSKRIYRSGGPGGSRRDRREGGGGGVCRPGHEAAPGHAT
ncbi:hypothetical protein, partial [Streptomyces sp. NPDC059783]|uniref:hypothetical protein n=1 Tax=Streptomyces sp. NPDC059783 TaxID=3346944 RepID=UPI0036562C73